jgi:hypothetical protein
MAVNKNPYREWQGGRQNADYRCTDTQITSLTRQQLSQPDYLRNSNRVNPGPGRNLRAKLADETPQLPHPLGSEDMWGWQRWTSISETTRETPLADGLVEKLNKAETPGKDYSPFGEVGGASSSNTD